MIDFGSLDALMRLILFVIPGFLAAWVFSLKMPRMEREFSRTILESIIFSCFIYSIILPVFLLGFSFFTGNRFILLGFAICVLLVLPVLCGYGLGAILQSEKYGAKIFKSLAIKNPIPKAWDYLFSTQKETFFILVTLLDDVKIGGLWHQGSYASSYPSEEDLYISIQYQIDENGQFIKELPLSKGCWINAKQIKYFELFEIKKRRKHES